MEIDEHLKYTLYELHILTLAVHATNLVAACSLTHVRELESRWFRAGHPITSCSQHELHVSALSRLDS